MQKDPEKNSPKKIDPEKIRAGLSRKQTLKIEYECDLLRTEPQKLFYIAPFLFNENVTSANTKVIEDPKIETTKEIELDSEPIYYNDYEGYI